MFQMGYPNRTWTQEQKMYNLNNNKIESNKTIKCDEMNNNKIEKQQNHKTPMPKHNNHEQNNVIKRI
jgi:hypothetical protein